MAYTIDDERQTIDVRGRGTGSIVKGRFERVQLTMAPEEARQITTEIFKDASRSIITYNDSPDVGFNASLNPYRGCEHGCIYCYARPTHEYFGLSSGIDFETKIFAKTNAVELLKKALDAKSYEPQVLGMSGVTDCYQPIEKELELTRRCLAILAEYRNPVVIVTKNHLVTRDLDILKELASFRAAHVIISITTLDKDVARVMEPRASTPSRRLQALAALREANIPASVNVAPVVPGLTDHEMPKILESAKNAGALSAHYAMVRLPYSVKDLFDAWLTEHFPDRKNKILNRLKEIRHGKLNSATFGERMVGNGPYADHVALMFARYRTFYGYERFWPLSAEFFRRPNAQLDFFS